MKQFVVFLAVSFFSLVFCVSSLSAAERDGSAVHTTLRGVQNLWTLIDEPMAQRTRKVGSSRVEEISPIRFTTRIRQLGSMHVELNQRMNVRGKSTRSEGNTFVEDSSVWLLRGEYTLRHHRKGSSDRQKIAATIYQKKDGDYGVLLSFRDNTRKRHRRIQYDLKGSFSRDSSEVQARISRFPSSLFQTRSCATEDSFAPNGMEDLAVSASMSASAATLKEVDVFAIADSSFSTVTGGEATANMLATINAASVFYESQLGLTFNVIGSHVFTSGTDPYSGVTAAGDFLTEITNDQPPHVTFGEQDLFHVFTGRDFDGGTIGIAWVGTVCVTEVNIGLSQFLDNATAQSLVFAHEVGHNFSANHDDAEDGEGFIMFPSLNLSANSFSAGSVSEIADHVSTRTCLADTDEEIPSATPTPTPTPSEPPSENPSPEPTATPEPETPGGGGGGGTGEPSNPGGATELSDVLSQMNEIASQIANQNLGSTEQGEYLDQWRDVYETLLGIEEELELTPIQARKLSKVKKILDRILSNTRSISTQKVKKQSRIAIRRIRKLQNKLF